MIDFVAGREERLPFQKIMNGEILTEFTQNLLIEYFKRRNAL